MNPLAKHFRQPAIYIKLPSNGQYWPTGSLDLPVNGQIPVYPMTARDEITIRTPDALLNGQGVVDVIQSCCPSIVNAWNMPSIDVDSVLLGIRIASYGSTMDFEVKCPKCNEEESLAMDLGILSSQIVAPDYQQPIVFDGLRIKLKPQPYFEVNRVNQLTFTEQQILRTINDSTLSDDEKKQKTDAYLKKLIDINVEVCVNSTESITTEDGTVVTDPVFIKEYYNSADFNALKKIQERLGAIKDESALKPIATKCTSCGADYEFPLEFDYASFFVQGF